MKTTEVKESFIELRAKGLSYSKISDQLKVSKQTLIDWSKDLRHKIANLKAIEFDALAEQHLLHKQRRIEMLGVHLQRIESELFGRDLSKIPTHKLLELMLKIISVSQEELYDCVFKAEQGFLSLECNGMDSWEG